MSDQIFIPDKIRVGFQERGDTFTKRLAYVIYFDKKGVLRKEKSWEGWRNKEIPFEDFDNKPHSGFELNKSISRYNWSHFSSNRSYIRIWDSRGFEFEITPENLIGILMHTDCNKRSLQGEFVYGYHGKDLVFVGKFAWHGWNEKYYSRKGPRLAQKKYIFTEDDGKSFIIKSSLEQLATKNSDDIVDNYAEIIEKFQQNPRSSKIVSFEVNPIAIDFTSTKAKYGYRFNLANQYYFKLIGNRLIEYNITPVDYHKEPNADTTFWVDRSHQLDITTQEWSEDRNQYHNGKTHWVGFSKEEILDMNIGGELYVTLENGRKFKVESLYNL